MTIEQREELRELRAVVRGFLEERSPESVVRSTMDGAAGYDRALWLTMARELGLQGLGVPERYGGADAGWAAQAVVFEEFGRALVCAPYLATVALAVPALVASGDQEAAQRWLPGIVSGGTVATLAVTESSKRWVPDDVATTAVRLGSTWRLTGVKPHVLDGAAADLVLVVARTNRGIGLFAVDAGDPGMRRTAARTSDRTRRIAEVELSGAEGVLVGTEGSGWGPARRAYLRAVSALACEQTGGAARVLDLSVEHAKTRIQFGRPIGSFQAVKHMCADMLLALEGARSAAREAIRAIDQDCDTAAAVVGIAGAVCSEAYAHCASQCVQLHGGLGYTWEHPSHLHVKRSRGSLVLLGLPRDHRRSPELLDYALAAPSEYIRGEEIKEAATEDRESFRSVVRAWLAAVRRPEGLTDYGPTPSPRDVAAGRAWQRILADAGYACLHWPSHFGGMDASVAEQAAFAEEAALAGVPRQLNIVGPDLVGPVLMTYGTDRQKALYLPRIRSGADMWCQLFSEPDAGSDLASVRTRARRTESGWVVDGQKVWTSGGDCSEYGLLLARSGGPGHAGLSVFVVPMSAPGITVRPLRQMDDESKFNEVFLDGVELRAEALVGEEGQGWRVATATLGRERLSLGSNAVAMFSALRDVQRAARERGRFRDGLRDEVVKLWIRVWLLRATWDRAVAEGAAPGASSFSVLKLLSSETHRDIGNLGIEALGLDALASENDEPLVRRMLVGHAQTILGGTSEIQRSVIADRVLGLPREPRTPGPDTKTSVP